MALKNHLCEPEALLLERQTTCGSSDHTAVRRAPAKAMTSKKRVQAGPSLEHLLDFFPGRTACKYFFNGYTQTRCLLFMLTQASQPLVGYFQLFLSCTGIL